MCQVRTPDTTIKLPGFAGEGKTWAAWFLQHAESDLKLADSAGCGEPAPQF